MADHDNDWLDDVDAAPAVHTVEAVSQSDEFVEWGCSTCGRLVRVTRSGGLTVLHRGDTSALHYGGSGVHLTRPASNPEAPPSGETVH